MTKPDDNKSRYTRRRQQQQQEKNDIKIELWDDKMKPKLHEWKILGNFTSKGKPTTESTIEKDINKKKFDRPCRSVLHCHAKRFPPFNSTSEILIHFMHTWVPLASIRGHAIRASFYWWNAQLLRETTVVFLLNWNTSFTRWFNCIARKFNEWVEQKFGVYPKCLHYSK